MEERLFAECMNLVTSRMNMENFYAPYFKSGHKFSLNKLVHCPFPGHEDKEPSFKVNFDGSFICFGCQTKGGGPIKFHQIISGYPSIMQSLRELYSECVEAIVGDDVLDLLHKKLMSDVEFVERLYRERGIRKEILIAYYCGKTEDGNRLTIPVHNKFGFVTCVHALNIFHTKEFRDCEPIRLKMPTRQLHPLSVLQSHDVVVLAEGQADMLCGLSHGIACATVGGSSNKLRSEDMRHLVGKTVVVCYDQDQAGTKGAKTIADQLMMSGMVTEVKILDLPVADGNKDLTDWLVKEGHTREEFFELVRAADFHALPIPELLANRNKLAMGISEMETGGDTGPPFVPLHKLRMDQYFNKICRSEAEVIGKAPETVCCPKQIYIQCSGGRAKCKYDSCPMKEDPFGAHLFEIGADDPDIIRLMDARQNELPAVVKDLLRCGPKCSVRVDVKKAYFVSKILLSPDPRKDEGGTTNTESIQMPGYYIGTDIVPNVPYLLTGYLTRHPVSGSAVYVAIKAEAMSDTLSSFSVTEEVLELLRPFSCFVKGKPLFPQMMQFYEHMGQTITKIRKRPLTHMAIDLVYFSPVSLMFCDQYIHKGALDVLVFGDTRCGKGFISEGLQRYYEHGEVISAENVSMMNLIGGIKVLSHFRGVCWGRLATRHKDTVIIDEMNSLKPDEIGRMSRVRSEGVAQVNKDGLRHNANAITGIIWLSNPRDRRLLRNYNYGIQALETLVPAPEDIARYDYIHAVAVDEVSAEDINANGKHYGDHKFTKIQCHNLILWAKSRPPDHFEFSTKAADRILRASVELGKKYSSTFPLILAENARFKLARISAAIAARIFNNTHNGKWVYVDEWCVDCAVDFLEALYDNNTLGLKSFSDMERKKTNLKEKDLEQFLRQLSDSTKMSLVDLSRFFLGNDHMMKVDLQDIFGVDQYEAQEIINRLIRCQAILRKYQHYVKTPQFIQYLRNQVEVLQ